MTRGRIRPRFAPPPPPPLPLRRRYAASDPAVVEQLLGSHAFEKFVESISKVRGTRLPTDADWRRFSDVRRDAAPSCCGHDRAPAQRVRLLGLYIDSDHPRHAPQCLSRPLPSLELAPDSTSVDHSNSVLPRRA
jgi:hypothetical protein